MNPVILYIICATLTYFLVILSFLIPYIQEKYIYIFLNKDIFSFTVRLLENIFNSFGHSLLAFLSVVFSKRPTFFHIQSNLASHFQLKFHLDFDWAILIHENAFI